jgi:hypothetical protein
MTALEHTLDDPSRRHEYRIAEPQPSLMLKDAILKWYDVAPPDEPVPLAIRALARRCLRDATKDGTLGVEDGLGFIALHRCDDDLYVLSVSTWRDANELEETVWAKSREDVLFHPWPADEPRRAAYAVSELGAFPHEHEAWKTYLQSSQDEPARHTYLRDCYSGLV